MEKELFVFKKSYTFDRWMEDYVIYKDHDHDHRWLII